MSETARAVARAQDVVSEAMAEHGKRGARLQARLRVGMVAFVWACLLIEPPSEHAIACYLVAIVYPLLWFLIWAWLRRSGRRTAALGWLPLGLDILVLGLVTLLAGLSAADNWTAYTVANGFFLLPILAATQLRPGVGLALAVPTVCVYVVSSVLTREANGEPWSSLVLRVVVLVAVCAGSVALSRIQRSRVLEIATLAVDRAGLLVELAGVEGRERRRLSEALHDGALQYVLGARMDLEDVRDGDPQAVDRLDQALTQSAGLLRRTVSELHPAVLEEAGLVRAVEDLAQSMRGRGCTVEVRTDGMPVRPATDPERVVYGAVRELLANVMKHSGASSVVIELDLVDGEVVATVTDDGTGFDEESAAQQLAAGHIGLASQRLRAEAVGGRLDAAGVQPHGTRMTVSVPLSAPVSLPA